MDHTLLPDYIASRAGKKPVITQTPLRITLGGGGTDVLWYSKVNGGAWISAAVNAYVYVMINKYHDPKLLKIYDGNNMQIVNSIRKIQNPIITECLSLTQINKGLEITTMSDISAKSGLGGSGAFEVGLLHGLHVIKGQSVSKLQLAREACQIEINRLKRPVGPQDQYITAIGGINYFEIDKHGRVSIEALNISPETSSLLEKNLLFFRTGIYRNADSILGAQKQISEQKNNSSQQLTHALNEIKNLGHQVKQYLLTGQVDEIGRSFDKHWKIKKSLSAKISTDKIDYWYNEALKAGALGGKIMGAGGGGLFLFYVNKNRQKFRSRMAKIGLEEHPMQFDWEGTKKIFPNV